MGDFATCRKCKKPILWAKTPSGKSIPLDPTPTEAGNITISSDNAIFPSKVALIERKANGEKFYTSHFATCPLWARIRERKKKGAT